MGEGQKINTGAGSAGGGEGRAAGEGSMGACFAAGSSSPSWPWGIRGRVLTLPC